MSSQNAPIMRQAQAAIKAGQRQEARTLLQQAIRQDHRDHRAWAWLAGITPSAKASLGYARRAAMLQPDDPLVQKVLHWAERRFQAAEAAQAEAQPEARHSVAEPPRNWRQLFVRSGLVLIILFALLGAAAFAWDRLDSSEAESPAVDLVMVDQPASQPSKESEAALPVVETATPNRPTASPTVTQRFIKAKNVAGAGDVDQLSTPRPTWTATPEATATPTATPTFLPTFVSPRPSQSASRPPGVGPAERWIDVNLETQTLSAFQGDSLVFSSLVSSGTWQHPTVTGQFRIYLRYASQTMDGRRLGYDYYLENVPYVMYFYQDYALHGTYWHNNFGTPMSHGCVNMRTADAEWIYNWSSIGTVVNVHY